MKRTLRPSQRTSGTLVPRGTTVTVVQSAAPPFDIAALLSSAGGEGVSLPALVLLARDITGNLDLTEADLRPHLTALLARGVLTCTNGRWRLR